MYKTLSMEQVKQYERDGILFPFPVLSPNEVSMFRSAIEELEERMGGKPMPIEISQCQLHFRWAYDLATHPAILDTVEDIIGPSILVHSTTLFCKHPADQCYVSWHQDGHYLGLSAPDFVSAWIALSDSNVENGCLRVIPGSHLEKLPHAASSISKHNLLSTGLEVAADFDEAQAVDVILRPGEISLHHVNLLHGSNTNRSMRKRIGFAVRYAAPQVSQVPDHHEVILARGRDDHHNYKLLEKPPTHSIEEGIAAQAEFVRWLRELRAS